MAKSELFVVSGRHPDLAGEIKNLTQIGIMGDGRL
jgi:hypothetical protein